MSASGTSDRDGGRATAVHEHRLGAGDLSALSRLVGLDRIQIAAATLDIALPSGLMSSRSLAVPLSGDQRTFVNITSDWIQLPYDNIHLLRTAVTSTPEDIPVSPIAGRDANSVGPCSWIALDDFGPVRCVEIVSYEVGDDVTRGEGGAVIVHEVVRYDRALRLRFASGRALTLSTHHGSILGAIEIRSGEEIGHIRPHARIAIRHTLH